MAKNEAKNYKYIVELVVTNIIDAQNNKIDVSEEEIVIKVCGIESCAQIGKSLHFSIEAKAFYSASKSISITRMNRIFI
ncbi:MAG TPA: hypothetical protein VIY47_13205 [Ignavibacteriaceae bacterium]